MSNDFNKSNNERKICATVVHDLTNFTHSLSSQMFNSAALSLSQKRIYSNFLHYYYCRNKVTFFYSSSPFLLFASLTKSSPNWIDHIMQILHCAVCYLVREHITCANNAKIIKILHLINHLIVHEMN